MRRVSRPLYAAALCAAALSIAAPANAAARGRIIEISADSGHLRVVFSANGLPDGTTIDPTSITLTVDGARVQAQTSPITGGQASIVRTAVLAIDTSGSMQGTGITGAKAAALAFLNAVPADVRVGLVTFSDRAIIRVTPTKDRSVVARAVTGLSANGETALYDAVGVALDQAGTGGARNVLILSDGGDTRSKTSLAATRSRIRDSKAIVDAVAFRTNEAQGAVLGQLATSSGGHVITTSQAADLAQAFAETARDISNQVLVTAPVPESAAGRSVTVSVSARAGSTALTDSAFTALPAAASSAAQSDYGPKPVKLGSSRLASRGVLYAALGALFLGITVLLWMATGALRRSSTGRIRSRLSIYTLTGRLAKEKQETTVLGDSAVARSAMELAGRVVKQRGMEMELARRLEAAGVPLRPTEWLLIHVGIAIGAAFLFLLLSGGGFVATVVGLLIGLVLPFAYLMVKESRRTSAFLAQLPDTLQLIAGSLSAGYSLPQGIDTVVREGAHPIAGEFQKAIVESRLGVPMEDALDGVAERMRSKDFAWIVMAIRIQREVGGNLAQVLTTVSATLRERERLRRQVKVLSAEGRLSAWILGLLPIVFALYLLLVRRAYIKPLYTESLGLALLIVWGVLAVVGVFWLRKAVKVEV
jgi:tight adherence protein B